MTKTFIPKEDQDLPDSFKIIITYVTGKTDEFDVVSTLPPKNGILELWTTDDECRYIIVENICKIEFDKEFSKVVAINKKRIEKEMKEQEEKLNKEKKDDKKSKEKK